MGAHDGADELMHKNAELTLRYFQNLGASQMKLILITAAALAMLTTTALADRPTPTEIAEFEAKAYDRVEPPQKIVAIHRGIRASVAFFSTDDKDYVAVPPGTVMSIVMRDKTTPTANCVLLPDTVTKGLRPRSPSGCFWTILE